MIYLYLSSNINGQISLLFGYSVQKLGDLSGVDISSIVGLLGGLECEHDLLLSGHLALA